MYTGAAVKKKTFFDALLKSLGAMLVLCAFAGTGIALAWLVAVLSTFHVTVPFIVIGAAIFAYMTYVFYQDMK